MIFRLLFFSDNRKVVVEFLQNGFPVKGFRLSVFCSRIVFQDRIYIERYQGKRKLDLLGHPYGIAKLYNASSSQALLFQIHGLMEVLVPKLFRLLLALAR